MDAAYRDSSRAAIRSGGAPFRWIRAAEMETFATHNGFHDFRPPDSADLVVVPLPTSEILWGPRDGNKTEAQWRSENVPHPRVRRERPPTIEQLPPIERVPGPVATTVFIKGYDKPAFTVLPGIYVCGKCGDEMERNWDGIPACARCGQVLVGYAS